MKTAIVRSDSYDNSKKSVEEALNLLGGLSKFIKKGMKAALKVNLVMAKKPDAAATTHPSFVAAVADLLTEAGASVVIIDSPGNIYKPEVLKGIYKTFGLLPLERENVSLNYDVSTIEADNPKALFLKKPEILKPLKDVDFIVNLPKMKTHCQMVFTGAVKNMFGSVPGLKKMEYHFRMPDYGHFADALIDIFLASSPGLSIMDGIVGMDGDGPTSGRVRPMGFVLASENAFCLDVAAARLLGIDPLKIPVLAHAAKRNLVDLDKVECVGLDPVKSRLTDVKLPSSMNFRFVSGIWTNIAEKLIRPKVHFSDRCKSCGYCAKICPAGAINMNDGKPNCDHSKCIRCFCCHELCPHAAVDIKKTFIMNFLAPVKKR